MYDEQAWNAGVLGSQTDPYGLPSGKRLHSYWKWTLIVDLPIKNGDFP